MSKEKIIPIVYKPFTSDNFELLKALSNMCEGIVYNCYMIEGAELEVVRCSVVETKDLEDFGVEENKEYIKAVKSFGKKYSIQFEISFVEREIKEEETTEDELDDL